MKKILKIDTPNDYARFVDAPELHPLVSIIHYDELPLFRHSLNNYGVYGLFIQRQFPKDLSYGMKTVQVSEEESIKRGIDKRRLFCGRCRSFHTCKRWNRQQQLT